MLVSFVLIAVGWLHRFSSGCHEDNFKIVLMGFFGVKNPFVCRNSTIASYNPLIWSQNPLWLQVLLTMMETILATSVHSPKIVHGDHEK